MKEKKSVVREIASTYQKAKKKLKGVILDEFVALRVMFVVMHLTFYGTMEGRYRSITTYFRTISGDSD